MMNHRLEERLKRLNIGRPGPELREKVLLAAEAALPEATDHPAGQGWLAGWRVEALLAGGIVATAALLLLLNGSASSWKAPMVCIDEAAVKALVEELDLNPEMEFRYRARLAWMEKRLAATRRFGNDGQIIE